MQAPVFNSGLPTTDAFYLVKPLKPYSSEAYLDVWKFYQDRWCNIHNEPLHDKNHNVPWARIPSLGEWSDDILNAPLGTDILIIDQYGRPEVSNVTETEDTPHKREWRHSYENPGLWHLIYERSIENYENNNEDTFNVEGRKASYDGFKSRDSYGWYYAVQDMKRYDYSHDQDLDCNQNVDCMTSQQINAMFAAVKELKRRMKEHGSPIRAILPPSNYEWGSYQDKRDWCTMILNLPYRLPEELHGIPRQLRDWCLDAARTLP